MSLDEKTHFFVLLYSPRFCSISVLTSPYVLFSLSFLTNVLSHHYHLDKYTFILEATVVIVKFYSFRGNSSDCKILFIFFFDEISLSKQNSPCWNAAFCGVKSRAILFSRVP